MQALTHSKTREETPAQLALLPDHLTLAEYRRLSWFKATHAAGAHLAVRGLPADQDAARHLAFGLWLRATGRLGGEFTLTGEGTSVARLPD